MGKISDLATFLSNKHNIKQKDAEKFISQMFELLGEELKTDKLVKVKGLGTFKVTTVKNRASVDVNTGERIIIEGRDKISFTPDASMKNLVNKPFAQFETVILKDGVDFAEIDKKYDMEEVDEESTETEEGVDAVEKLDEVDTVDTNEPVEETTSDPVTPEPIEVEQTVDEVKEENVEDKNENVVIEEQVGKADIEEQVETKEVSEEPISPIISTQEFEEEDEEEMKRSEELIIGFYSMNNKLNEKDQQIEQFVQEKQKEQEKIEAEKLKLAKELEAYNNYDERVINGDYKIVGIEKEVTAVQGQTLKSISRMELGPGMDCYVQAVNPDIKMVLIGQQVKIPKLVHK